MVSSINNNMSLSQSTAETRLEPQLSQLERLRKKRGITSELKDRTIDIIDQPTVSADETNGQIPMKILKLANMETHGLRAKWQTTVFLEWWLCSDDATSRKLMKL